MKSICDIMWRINSGTNSKQNSSFPIRSRTVSFIRLFHSVLFCCSFSILFCWLYLFSASGFYHDFWSFNTLYVLLYLFVLITTLHGLLFCVTFYMLLYILSFYFNQFIQFILLYLSSNLSCIYVWNALYIHFIIIITLIKHLKCMLKIVIII